MPLYVLDTDHLTLLQRADAQVMARFDALPQAERAASVASFEEQIKGRLAQINAAKTAEKSAAAYRRLIETQNFYCSMRLLTINQATAEIYLQLRKIHRQHDKMDLRIAATALAHNAILVTRNTRDFAPVENLRLDNWA